MPVKDYHPGHLRRALGSVVGQTTPRWRLQVVGEPEGLDELRGVLAPYLADPRFELIANEGRKLAGAFNTGMRHARTDFVAVLLGDDMWAPEAVEVLTARIEARPEVDFFHSSRIIVDGDDAPLSSVQPSLAEVGPQDFVSGAPVKHLLCWRRERALAIGGMDETLNSVGPDDYDFPWSMAEDGAVFEAVGECLYLYRDHRDCFRLTTHLPRSVHTRELRRIMRKHGMGRLRTERRVLSARRLYLRQCLYRSSLDRWLKQRVGFEGAGWRERYE